MAVISNEPFYFQNPTVLFLHKICTEGSSGKDYGKPKSQKSLLGTSDKYARDKG